MAEYFIGKISDQGILRMIFAFRDKFGMRSLYVNSGELNIDEKSWDKLANRSDNTTTITAFNYIANGDKFSLHMNRANKPREDLDPVFFDLIVLKPSPPHTNLQEVIEAEALLKEHVSTPRPSDPGGASKAVIGILNKEIAALSELHHRMLADANELRQNAERDMSVRLEQIRKDQEEAQAKITKHEEEANDRIAAREADLSEKQSQFDLSDYMRSRRKQREDITSQIQAVLQGPQSPRSSLTKLQLTGLICMAGASVSGFFAYESFQSFIAETNSIHLSVKAEGVVTSPGTNYLLWLLGVRSLLLTGIAVGFLAYLMTFVRRSYDEDVSYHRDLQRYSMDINRASWVIETAMEMTSKENVQLPERWVEGATANLFRGGSNASEVSSLSALGAVLGLGPELEAGPEGVRLKLPRGATKAAARDAG